MVRICKIVKRNHGFTLIELMVTIMVIGIIAAIAIPSYHDYIVRARIAEAYQSIDVLTKKQIIYFNENGHFNYLVAGQNPFTLDPNTMTMTTDVHWTSDWIPVPEGSHIFFSYNMYAGSIDSSGTGGPGAQVTTTPPYIRRAQTSGTVCNNPGPAATTLGAVAQNNYDFVVIAAAGDLNSNGDNTCTGLLRLIDASPGSERKPTSSGIVVLNYGN